MLSLSTIAVNWKNRADLKVLFKNKSRLSETQFADLIDSTLNKKEDKFSGVWQEGRTYSPGDVVYYQGVLWEVQGKTEICAKPNEPPGTGSNWKSYVKDLEQKVNKLEQNLTTLNTAFTEYKQQMELRLDKLLKYITLLSLGVAIALLWLVIESIYQLFKFAA
ncbi:MULTISPECIES: carbohydrate-binding protein [Calothrix]|uniref:Carbohydrate-binding protein n=2 Tax=Calothrix TaxID=1186 RepID=A0ABR8AHG8_9CYAN|nr:MULTISPECIES: carbohydrate-binding protein [Calothrix]MBD2199393.1 carbohydrate-binding protein [Calothrix parietina FACHB-288]MBD2228067.1 carbohydrate-binding protein [Calothrix anomala FACHB-343]